MIKYYDTHAHININPLENEVDVIIEECKKNNTILNCIGVDIETSLKSIEYANKYFKIVFACVGFHPIDSYLYKNDLDKYINQLENIIVENRNKIVAIGEIGLDYYLKSKDDFLDKEYQKKCFRRQLELAQKYDLPINIHNRNADDDIIEILSEFNIKKIMIHCFSSNIDSAITFLNKGYYLSIPGIITFKNANDLREVIKQIDLSKIVIETDCPFLTPIPYRGKTNYPYYVKYVANEIAKIKEMKLEEVEKILLNNAIEFFNPQLI